MMQLQQYKAILIHQSKTKYLINQMHSDNNLANHQNIQNMQNLRKKISNFSYHIQNDLIYKSQYYSLYKGVNETNYNKVNIKVIKIPQKPSSHSSQQIELLSKQGKGSDKNQIKEYLMLQNYIRNVQKLKHSKIVKFIETYSTANNFYIIYQRFSNISFGRFIEQHKRDKSIVSFKSYARIFVQVYQGVKYLINIGYLMPTISKHTILVKQEKNSRNQNITSAKLSGAGYSIKMIQNQTTFNWEVDIRKHVFPDIDHSIIAPETLSSHIFTIQSQVWSIGIILYEAFVGRVPWKKTLFSNDLEGNVNNRKDVSFIIKAIKQGNIERQINRRFDIVSEQIKLNQNFNQYEVNPTFLINLKELIVLCLQINPEKRIQFSSIQKHPFFTKVLSRLPIYQYNTQKNTYVSQQQVDNDNLSPFKRKNRIDLICKKRTTYQQIKVPFQANSYRYIIQKRDRHQIRQKKYFSDLSNEQKLQVFNASFNTQFDYLEFLGKMFSLITCFISQINGVKLYSLSSQNRKINIQILLNLVISIAKQILIQLHAIEKSILERTNQLNFDQDIWKCVTLQQQSNQSAKKIWTNLQRRIGQLRKKLIDQKNIKGMFQKWIQALRIKNFKKLIAIANTNFDYRCCTQTEITGIYYALKFIRSIMKDLYLDMSVTKDRDLHGFQLKNQMSNNTYFNSLLLFDFVLSYYQIVCLRFDDVQVERFGQLSGLAQIVHFIPNANDLFNYQDQKQKDRQTNVLSNSVYMIGILKQEPIVQRVEILREKIEKLQLSEKKGSVKNIQKIKRHASEKQ